MQPTYVRWLRDIVRLQGGSYGFIVSVVAIITLIGTLSKSLNAIMVTTTLTLRKHHQSVRLPAQLRLAPEVKQVHIRAVGLERIITPVGHLWDSFFLAGPRASDDFMAERVRD